MLEKSIKWILVGSIINSVSIATSLNDIFLINFPRIESQTIDTQKTDIKETDFSGSWSGSCKDISGPVRLDIYQSEDTITINGQEFRLGAMTTMASSNSDSYNNSQMRFTWNSSKTMLTLNGTSINSKNNENMMYTSMSKSSMAIEGEQLIMKIQAKFYKNLDSMGNTFDRTCIFSKQQ